MWAEQFAAAPDFGKVAVDGVWERALTFVPGELTRPEEVAPIVGDAPDVACEAFFGQSFFGIRQTHDAGSFVARFAGAVAAGEGFFEVIERDFDLPLGRDFEFAEIGAEGAWKSVGPYRVADLDRVWHDLRPSRCGRTPSTRRRWSSATPMVMEPRTGSPFRCLWTGGSRGRCCRRRCGGFGIRGPARRVLNGKRRLARVADDVAASPAVEKELPDRDPTPFG